MTGILGLRFGCGKFVHLAATTRGVDCGLDDRQAAVRRFNAQSDEYHGQNTIKENTIQDTLHLENGIWDQVRMR